MEKNANYTVVGTLCLLLLVGLIMFVIWLAKFQFDREYEIFDLVFEGPVRGLSQGGEVHFNGIKVGEITRLMLDRRNPRLVIAEARLDAGVPIKRDSFATLEPQGVTGVNYVQINAGSDVSPLLRASTAHGAIPVIPTHRSTLDNIFQGSGTVMTRAVAVLDRVNRVLSDDNIASFTATMSDARDFADTLKAHRAMIADTERTVRDADAAAVELLALERSGRGLVEGDAQRTMRNFGDAADETRAAAQSLQTTSESLDRLLTELQSSPRSALARPASQDLEVRQ